MPAAAAPLAALVTGASGGLGEQFARQLAIHGFDLILVARDEQRLQGLADQLRTQHGVEVEVLPADLADAAQCAQVEQRLARDDTPIDLLINNAGIGLKARFHRGPIADEQQMLDLNVTAVLRLTHAVLPTMIARGGGAVLNISSVAGFGAVSAGSTYSASKAWVTNFSESLHAALTCQGVAVVALCPGFIRTQFHARSGLPGGSPGSPWWLSADRVAREGLAAIGVDRLCGKAPASGKRRFRARRAVVVPSLRYQLVGALIRHLPQSVLRLAANRRAKAY